MTFFAKRLDRIKPSPTFAIGARAAVLKAEGRDIISLSLGEPDFDTPEFVKDAAIAAMRAGQTKYTAVDGTPHLKDAIIAKFKRDNGLDFKREEIIVGSGGKQVLYNALMATLNPGDEVIVPAPYWVSYPDMVLLADGMPVFVECPEAQGFKLTAAALEKVITPKTKWLILNSPGNPTGAAYTHDELKALTDVLLRHPQVWLMCDDIYEHLIYGDFKFFTALQVEPALRERCLTVNGASKAYSMTGWRIGFAGGPVALIKQMTNVQGHSTSNPSSISQAAAAGGLNGDQSFLDEWRRVYKARRDLVVAKLNTIDGITCLTPPGAFYVYPSCAGLIGRETPDGRILTNDEDVVTYFLEIGGVACVHGAAFGMSPNFRVSYAAATAQLEEACNRIEKACAALKIRETS